MHKALPILAAMTIILLAPPALAAPDTPPALAGIETVDNNYVAKAVANRSALLVDYRSEAGFRKGTIPGAINCPGIQQDPASTSDSEIAKASQIISGCPSIVSSDKARDIIAFCSHVQCWISPKASIAMKAKGFSNVKWLRTGFDTWKAEGRPVQ